MGSSFSRFGRGTLGALGGAGVLALGAWLGGGLGPAQATSSGAAHAMRATSADSRAYPNKSKRPPLAPGGQRAAADPQANPESEIPLGDALSVNGQPMQLSMFTTRDTPEQVISFYQDAFLARGLVPVAHATPRAGHISTFSSTDGMQRFVNALPQGDGETMVTVGITDPRRAPTMINSAKDAPFPVPPENRGFLSYASEDSGIRAQSGQYTTAQKADDVLAYYRKELLPVGFHEQPGGGTAMTTFQHPNGTSISVAIQALEKKGGAVVFVNRVEGARQVNAHALLQRLRDERGQATSESAVLLVTTLIGLGGVGGYLLTSHPDWLNALNIHIHGFYYLLSLPFP